MNINILHVSDLHRDTYSPIVGRQRQWDNRGGKVNHDELL